MGVRLHLQSIAEPGAAAFKVSSLSAALKISKQVLCSVGLLGSRQSWCSILTPIAVLVSILETLMQSHGCLRCLHSVDRMGNCRKDCVKQQAVMEQSS